MFIRSAAIALALGIMLLPGCTGETSASRPSVLVVGIDAADWRIINILRQAGHLPAFESLIRDGAAGALDARPAQPRMCCYTPRIWCALMSGVRYGGPDGGHGIPDIDSPSSDWKVPPLWDVLAADGGTSTVIAMFGSWPPDPDVAITITRPALDWAAKLAFNPYPWPPPHQGLGDRENHVRPRGLLEGLFEEGNARFDLFLARDRLAMDALLRMQPGRPMPTDLTVIHLWGVDHAQHLTWGKIQDLINGEPGPLDEEQVLAWARSWEETGPIQELSVGNVASQYLEIDRWLQELLGVRHHDYVVLLSDHGMGRHRFPNAWPTGDHSWRVPEAHFNVFVLAGPGVKKGYWLEDGTGTVLDVAPTLAYLLGLPVAEDLAGHVLEAAFTPERLAQFPIATVPSWKTHWTRVPRRRGRTDGRPAANPAHRGDP